jgi:gluconokinase
VILIVAGVAGSGKTTVGALLAGRLRWRFADADTFHSEANVAKMRAGIPLTDEDRQPWLRAVTAWMDERIADGQSGVITCSALKRAYRAELLDGRPAATMVFLMVSGDGAGRGRRPADRGQDHRHPLALRGVRPGRLARPRRALMAAAAGQA